MDPPPPPPLNEGKGGRIFQKLSHLGKGVQNFLLERGNKPEKGVDVEMGEGVATFFITLQFS